MDTKRSDVKRSQRGMIASFVFLAVCVAPVSAADMMLIVPEVSGQSAFLPGGIDVTGYSHGVEVTAIPVGTGGGASKVSMKEFTVTKKVDRATPALYQKCCAGKHFANVNLYVRQMKGEQAADFYVITLSDALITSCKTSDSATGLGQETVTFQYSKISTSVTSGQDDKGQPLPPVTFSWDPTKV